MLAVIGTDIVLVLLSVLMINLSEEGQYPVFWFGFGWFDKPKEQTAHQANEKHNDLTRSNNGIDEGGEDHGISSIKESV